MTQSNPIYLQIKDYLKVLIMRNQNDPTFMLPSEKQLSLKFNASRIPAKRALEELKSEGLIYRIQGKGSFISGSKKPVSRDKYNVCLFIPNMTSKFIMDIATDIMLYFSTVGTNVFIVVTSDNSQMEDELIEIAIKKQFDGLIIFPVIHHEYNDSLLRLVLDKIPAIFVGRNLPGLNISSISCDHYLQTKKAMNFLLAKGHKEIGFISECASDALCYEYRIRAYKESILEIYNMKSLHLQEIEFFRNEDFHAAMEQISREIESFFVQNPTITALILSNLALQPVYKYMRDNNFSLNRLEIMVFDLPEYSTFSPYPPPLIIDQHPSEMGHLAAKQLYEQIINNEAKKEIVVDSRIMNLVTKTEI
ncbi:MAG: GntR family transcriptional regulator [Saccharofermentanales bacterium]